MPELVEPKPEFRGLSEPQVREALEDADKANPVAREVERLFSGYMANIREHRDRTGDFPYDVLAGAGSLTPIEVAASRLVAQALREPGDRSESKFDKVARELVDSAEPQRDGKEPDHGLDR